MTKSSFWCGLTCVVHQLSSEKMTRLSSSASYKNENEQQVTRLRASSHHPRRQLRRSRSHNSVGAFATSTAEHLAKSPLPHSFIFGFSYAIPFLEAILGLTLILGVFTRISLVCGAVFMMLLTIGVTSIQQWDLASQQLLYSVVFFLLLYLIEHNALALDTYLRHTTQE